MNKKLEKDYQDYQSYVAQLKNKLNYDNDYFIIYDDNDRIHEEVCDEKELKDTLYRIYESLCEGRDQDSYDDDSSYFRSNFESIGERNAIRVYEDLKDGWSIKHIFVDADENEIDSIYPNIEFFIDF